MPGGFARRRTGTSPRVMTDAIKGLVSIDGEQYVPRRELDDLRQERDRLADEVDRLRRELTKQSSNP
jgi:hypothetical protein